MILHSRRYLCSATVMTNRHPLVPVQLSSAQTLLAGRCLINTSCSTVNDATWPSSKQRRFLQSTNCQKAKEKQQTHRLNFTKDLFLHFLNVLDHAFLRHLCSIPVYILLVHTWCIYFTDDGKVHYEVCSKTVQFLDIMKFGC